MDIFSSKGGLAVGSMLESFKNTEYGAKILQKLDTKEDKENKDIEVLETNI